ncbi:MAG: 16S rRNA (guanine(966)-N(2))-methyltransferase RsmD [Alphaproteobacteria bacterium]|nr:16S rRNA (guanine(966)-N(2))-methyltransferase RsmD [Alphaproteobacteria bacterium]
MRIVAGRLRGRSILAPADQSIRPTSDRTRESLFNILRGGRLARADGQAPLTDALVLDGFAGTGALGLEALSQGARRVTFIDNDRAALALIRRNLHALDQDDDTDIVEADMTRLPRAAGAHDLVFLDPPYGEGLIEAALPSLARGGWLAADATIVAEMAKRDDLEPPPGFAIVDERRYGRTKLIFLRLDSGKRLSNA